MIVVLECLALPLIFRQSVCLLAVYQYLNVIQLSIFCNILSKLLFKSLLPCMLSHVTFNEAPRC